MNKRIFNKRLARFSARCISIPMTLDHANPSFWQLNSKEQRRMLKSRLSAPFGPRGLGIAKDIANYVVRQWVATTETEHA